MPGLVVGVVSESSPWGLPALLPTWPSSTHFIADAVALRDGVISMEWPPRCAYWHDRRVLKFLNLELVEMCYRLGVTTYL